ncbi:hypothetical protein PPIS_a0992 [Pseudoalteromonas piscicida]|uniref:Uncharacterized protein n=1 Tax=Pseudoalteromonas piscicida TaxID=43662 RepID=A0ABN5C9A8_PSEO7|nr:hypothetical protein PPIS_a0992 [Pseudoalteromonas piscicida]
MTFPTELAFLTISRAAFTNLVEVMMFANCEFNQSMKK